MGINRREFFKLAGVAGAAVAAGSKKASASSGDGPRVTEDTMGVLVDVPRCIGCRRCEYACQDAHEFNPPPIETFEDKSVFEENRRPVPRAHTIINRYDDPNNPGKPIYNKFNCLHCNHPACWSACLVTAFHKQEDGAVVYDANRCMGCRYCMVACPFEIPTYDYDNPLTPQVRKCNLCAHLVPDKIEVPACVKICPAEVMTYGRRSELLELARERIRQEPDKYIDHIYGEHEAGGTSWIWISSVPFEQVGLPKVQAAAPPELTESIQHSQFRYFVAPLLLYGLLGATMRLTKPEEEEEEEQAETTAAV